MSQYTASSINSLNGTVSTAGGTSQGAYCIQVQNASPNTFVVEGSLDGSNWVLFPVVSFGTGLPQSTITSDGVYFMQTAGLIFCRVRCSAYVSGTTSVIIFGADCSFGPNNVMATLQASSANIGTVTITGPAGGGVSPASYSVASAAGTTTVKNSPGVVYGIFNNGGSIGGTVLVADNATTVLSNSLLGSVLGTAPFAVSFPNGIQFNTSIKVTLGGVTTPSVTVLYR